MYSRRNIWKVAGKLVDVTMGENEGMKEGMKEVGEDWYVLQNPMIKSLEFLTYFVLCQGLYLQHTKQFVLSFGIYLKLFNLSLL